MAHQHREPGPTIGPDVSVTNSVEDQINELRANLEKLLEALNLEWCDECNAYVPSSDDAQNPNPTLLDPLNPDGPNYEPPLPL
jgi:hypothetical protein